MDRVIGKSILVYLIIGGNLVSIFFNFRWTFDLSVYKATRLFFSSYPELIVSTILSLVGLYFLCLSRGTLLYDEDCLDADLTLAGPSVWFLRSAVILTLVGCTLPELLQLVLVLID